MLRLLTSLVFSALLLCGCGSGEPKTTLTVLAGSELKDIEPKLDEIRRETGVKLKMEYIGTLDGADALVSGTKTPDLAWFSHAKYLTLLQQNNKIIRAEEKIGLSPVVPAVKQSLAKKWGWLDKPVTWSDIAAKAKAGEFRYAMTDPTASNSGFSTVIGVQAAFSGTSDAITADSVDQQQLRAFFKGQSLTSGSSGWLAEAYINDQGSQDGLFNYESVILAMNESGRLNEPLVVIYPKEGVVTADYPLILVNEDKRESYKKLVDYLLKEDFQRWMMQNTYRRPISPQVKQGDRFPEGFQLELPFPAKLSTVNQILFSFLNTNRKPSHSFFVLDVSGSMNGDRIYHLKEALLNLAGGDNSLTGQFAQFRNREKVTIIRFNNQITKLPTVTIEDNTANGQDSGLQTLRKEASALVANGGTAIYDALKVAYQEAEKARRIDGERFYSIVLMSDGDSTTGDKLRDFRRFYRQHSDAFGGIRVFPILFGASNDEEMKELAELTGGKVFDSRKDSLAKVFKKIRGYQ